jgi:hypothetical protein
MQTGTAEKKKLCQTPNDEIYAFLVLVILQSTVKLPAQHLDWLQDPIVSVSQMAVWLPALHASCPLTPGRFLVLISVRGGINPRDIV